MLLIFSRMFPLLPTNKDEGKSQRKAARNVVSGVTANSDSDVRADVCLCIESGGLCSCNSGVVFSEADILYEEVSLPHIGKLSIFMS